jgi:hypothetical protein
MVRVVLTWAQYDGNPLCVVFSVPDPLHLHPHCKADLLLNGELRQARGLGSPEGYRKDSKLVW